jgi:predicted RNA-binding Zn-ribbon protein involved in translation (DUF1610 family)
VDKIYYIDRSGQTEGPFNLEELRGLYATRAINEKTVWTMEGGAAWVPLSELPGVCPSALEDKELTKCKGCGRDISTKASSCPHCGCLLHGTLPQHQERMACPHCGSHAVGKVRGLQGIGEVFLCIVLFFLFLVPGLIYYIYMESVPYCSGCGRRV